MPDRQYDGVILEDKWGKTYLCSTSLLARVDLGEDYVTWVHDRVFGCYFLHDLVPHWNLRQIWADIYQHAKPWAFDLSTFTDFQLRDALLDIFAADEMRIWQLTEGWGAPPEDNGIGDGGLAPETSSPALAPARKKALKPDGGVTPTDSANATTAAHSSTDTSASSAPATQNVTERFGDNEAVWVIDEQGRPLSVTATLTSTYSEARTSQEKQHQRTVGGDARLSSDDGGHIIGHRFMSDQGLKNLFPQDANLNRGAYKSMENEWEDWTKEGYEVRLTVELDPPGAERPDNVIAEYNVYDKNTGKRVFRRRHEFNNQRGETFERVARKDMQDYRG